MNGFLTNDTKVIILLCGILGNDKSIKPLTQGKYNLLARWLQRNQMRPEDLLEKENILQASKGTNIEFEYLEALLNRGVQLGFSIEDWQRNGIWIISRSDKNYPTYYKKHLKEQSPPLLYGIGDISLLNNGGVGIVGSRKVDDKGILFTEESAKICALNNIPVISGAAKGVDQISMITALNSGGVSVGVLAENLLKTSLDRNYRNAIADKKLVLISHRHPNSHFTVGAAMARNKLIYGLSDFTLVVSSEFKKGGTWAGAEEELKRANSIPVFVRSGESIPLGNSKLLDLGAIKWPNKIDDNNLKAQLKILSKNRNNKEKDINLFNIIEQHNIQNKHSKNPQVLYSEEASKYKTLDTNREVYEVVLPIILKYIESVDTVDELSKVLNITKAQLNHWIILAVEDKRIKKLSRPIRYVKI